MQQVGLRIFRIFGIDVYLHWLWIVIAVLEVDSRRDQYSSLSWNIAECLTLFLIVLLHELGHALACRSVDGQADRIILWPLGGLAEVRPPPRPGPTLWTVAAGPLVNLLLVPVTLLTLRELKRFGAGTDAITFARTMVYLNLLLLVFNAFPAYPLDGGQILRCLFWFVIGRINSLFVATIFGMLGSAGLLAAAIALRQYYLGIVAIYMGWRAVAGFQQALKMAQMQRLPRHAGAFCPACGAAPLIGPFWRCPCGHELDTFAQGGVCPACGNVFESTTCIECGNASPRHLWHPAPPPTYPAPPGPRSVAGPLGSAPVG